MKALILILFIIGLNTNHGFSEFKKSLTKVHGINLILVKVELPKSGLSSGLEEKIKNDINLKLKIGRIKTDSLGPNLFVHVDILDARTKGGINLGAVFTWTLTRLIN